MLSIHSFAKRARSTTHAVDRVEKKDHRDVRGNVGGDVLRRVDARRGDRGTGAWTREERRRFKLDERRTREERRRCFDRRREIVAREGWGEDEEGEIKGEWG